MGWSFVADRRPPVDGCAPGMQRGAESTPYVQRSNISPADSALCHFSGEKCGKFCTDTGARGNSGRSGRDRWANCGLFRFDPTKENRKTRKTPLLTGAAFLVSEPILIRLNQPDQNLRNTVKALRGVGDLGRDDRTLASAQDQALAAAVCSEDSFSGSRRT